MTVRSLITRHFLYICVFGFDFNINLQVTTVSMSNAIAPNSPDDGPNSNNNNNNLTSDVIIMDESSSQPINLNILPRMITQNGSTNSHSNNVEEEVLCINQIFYVFFHFNVKIVLV